MDISMTISRIEGCLRNVMVSQDWECTCHQRVWLLSLLSSGKINLTLLLLVAETPLMSIRGLKPYLQQTEHLGNAQQYGFPTCTYSKFPCQLNSALNDAFYNFCTRACLFRPPWFCSLLLKVSKWPIWLLTFLLGLKCLLFRLSFLSYKSPC